MFRELVALEAITETNPWRSDATELVRESLREYHELMTNIHSSNRYRARGRPRIEITYTQLAFLLENRFTVPQIAAIKRVSCSTVERRMVEYGLSVRELYSTISDGELDRIVRVIYDTFPMCGNKVMAGHLLARGYRVQQSRIRESQRKVDPGGVAIRQLTTIRRRQYAV